MKKYFLQHLAPPLRALRLLCMALLLCVGASAEARSLLTSYAVRDKAFYYQVYDDGTATLVGIYAQNAAPEIPYSAQIETGGDSRWRGQWFRVTEIASDAFLSTAPYKLYNTDNSIYNATLVNTVTRLTGGGAIETIGTNALGNLPNLTAVELDGGYTKACLAPLKTRLVTLGFKGTLPEGVCEGFTKLTTVKANSIVNIGANAFKNCTNLQSFTTTYCPMTIGDYAFYGCSKLTTFTINAEYGSQLTSIGNYAFYGCSSLPTLEEGILFEQFTGLETIGDYAFANALARHPKTTYAYVRVPLAGSKLTSIGAHAFDGVTKLRYLTLPPTLKTIGEYAFYGCESGEIEKDGFTRCTALESIGKYAFSGWNNTYSLSMYVDLTNCKLTTINEGTFRNSRLASVKLPASVTTIGSYAFAENNGLKTFESSCNSLSIDDYAFYKTGLTSFDFTHTLNIGSYAFSNTKLTEVVCPTSFQYLPEGIFMDCTALTSFDASRSQLKSIGAHAFEGCYSLATVKLNRSYFTGSIGAYAFAGTLKAKTSGGYYNTKLTISGYDRTSSIGSYAFQNSSVNDFTWPSHLSTVSDGVLNGSKYLSTLILPEGVENAGSTKYPFADCGHLKRVEIPSTMKDLYGAFHGTQIDTLIVHATACLSNMQCWRPDGTSWPNKGKAYVPYSSIDKYKSGSGYSLTQGFDIYGLAPTSITLDKTQATIRRGKSVTVAVKSVTPSDASPVMYWLERSGDKCYERTDAEGSFYTTSPSITLKGTQPGECTFTPQAESYYNDQPRAKATFKLTVLEPDTVQFEQKELTLAIGKSVKQTAQVMPLAECDQTIYSWTTSDPTVCSVADDGTVTARNSGTAVITAYTPGRGASGHYTVNVPALKNDLDKSTLVLKPGESAKLNASVYGSTVTWKSDNEAVATVDQQGNVRAVSEGVAYIITSIPEDAHSHAKCMVIVTTEKVMYVGGIYYTTVDDEADGAGRTGVKVTNLAFGKAGYYGPTDDRDEYKAIITIPPTITYDSQTYDVTEVGDYAFYRMQDLQRVNVPASVVRVGNSAFENCKNLVLVSFASGSRLETIGFNAFKGCSKLMSMDIPNGVSEIGSAAFMECASLPSLVFPSALVTELSQNVCRGCTAMEEVTLSGVKVIGKAAFRDCESLATIRYNGTNLKMVDEEAFMGCSALPAVTLPEGVASIQNAAYEDCTSLASFTFPATIEGVGAVSFKGCSALQSVDFKGTAPISFGESAFKGCSALNKVSVASVGAWAQSYFAGKDANPLARAGHLYQGGAELTSVTLPAGVAFVGQYAFAGATSLTSLTLPASVKAISDEIAPASTTVSKPAATLDLASRDAATMLALDRSSLHLVPGEKLTVEAETSGAVTWSSTNTAVATVKNGEITAVGAGTAVVKATADGKEGRCLVVVGTESPVYVGATYYKLIADAAGSTAGGGSGAEGRYAVVTNLGQADPMAYPADVKRTEYSGILALPAAVTYKGESYPVAEIGMQAFYAMEHLQKVIIPAGVKSVGVKAFEDSKQLARVEFAGTQCADIAQRAFYGCSKLDEVVLPNALTMLNKELMRKCTGLKTITLPSSLTTVGEWAMAECSALPAVTLPAKVASLQNSAFSGNTQLASLTFPASLEGLGALSLEGCTALQSVEFKGTKPVSIGESAFKGCSALNKVTVVNLAAWVQSYFATPWSNPTTLAHNLYVGTAKQTGMITLPAATAFVGQYALSGCTDVTGVTLPAKTTAYSDDILRGCGGETVTAGETALNLATRPASSYLELDRKSVVAMPGDKFTIVPDATTVSWESSNPSVATVSSEGKVTVLGMGTAVITAKASGRTGKCMVTATATSPAYVGAFYYKMMGDGTASFTNAADGVVAFGTERHDYAGIVSIPATVTYDGKAYSVSEVGASAFYKMAHLQKVIVPASVATLGSQAFESSERMKRIEFAADSRLTSIQPRAFYECKALDHVVLPAGITTINEATFRYCESLTDITLPVRLTNINEYAFASCTALEQIALPSTLSAIQDYAFALDAKLLSLELPVAVQGIGKLTFQNCTALRDLHFMNEGVMTIGENAFSGCTGLKSVDVDHLDRWAESMFTNEKSNPLYYAKSIAHGGQSLTSVVLPATTSYVNQYAFVNCEALKSVLLPKAVTTVSDNIFLGCSALERVVSMATIVPAFIGTRALTDMKPVFDKATLYVPAVSMTKYAANNYWKSYHAIEALGDVDGNGTLDRDDVTAVREHILGRTPAEFNLTNADVTGDGIVTIGDLTLIVSLLR